MSVIVAATDAQADFLDECLESLRWQTHHDLQIIVVPHGPSSRVLAIAGRHAAADWRVQVDRHVRSSLGRARDVGAKLARGKYLAFAGGADRMPVASLELLVRSLEESGSDFAFGRVVRPTTPSRSGGSLQKRVHRVARSGIGIGEFPQAITDVFVENRLFRTDFWRRTGLSFPKSGGPVRALTMVQAFLASARFDVLTDVTFHAMNRGEGVPFGHLSNAMVDLGEWLTAQTQTESALDRSGSRALRDAWLFGVLDQGALPFIDDVERATSVEWSSLSKAVRAFVNAADSALWSRLRAESRVKAWLTAHDKRTELEEFVAQRWYADGNQATDVEHGVVYADLPFFRNSAVGVPDGCFELTAEETSLHVSLRRVTWADRSTIELELFAYIDFVDMQQITPDVIVTLVNEQDASRVKLPVTQLSDPAVTRFGAHRHQDYDTGVIRVSIDAELMAQTAREWVARVEEYTWTLDIELAVRGVARNGTVTHVDEQGSPQTVEARYFDMVRLGVQIHSGPDLRFVASDAQVMLRFAQLEGRTIRGCVSSPIPSQVASIRAIASNGQGAFAEISWVGGAGSFELCLPEIGFHNAEGQPRWWRVRVLGDLGNESIAWPAELAGSWITADPVASIAVHRSPAGDVEFREVCHTPLIQSVELEEESLVLTGRWLGSVPERWSLRMADRGAVSVGQTETDGVHFRARFELVQSKFGLPASPLPPGGYRILLELGEGRERHDSYGIVVGDCLRALCPIEMRGPFHRLRAFRTAHGLLGIRLAAPLSDDELGPFAQQKLQSWLVDESHAIDRSAVYFQSYVGQSATDSPLAIHHELARLRPDLTLYWGIADHSSTVPELAQPVLMRSRRWYEVLATSGYVVTNIDLDRWFQKQPSQRILQTFHGYPSKSMGIRLWTGKQFTPRRVALELERTSGDWDLILTPTPEMDQYYRTEYRYEGEIHNKGYPRDDVLTSVGADQIRRQVRRRLDIRDGQTAVLYAPTWRDDLAVNYRSATIVKHLDLESASAALGGDYVLLMRGHRFNTRGAKRASESARVIDVTDYPEVNDLILAADVAVLDYSSLRFDFGLTGKPMLFLVPDLNLYTGGVRGFLYDYRSTAPGPLLDTADQVVDPLLNLDRTAASHADQLQRFTEKYHYWQDGRAAERVVRAFFHEA